VDLVITSNNGFILTKRSIDPFRGTWGFPGGRIYYEEPIVIALRRISEKETGLKIANEKFLGFMEMRDETFQLKNFVHTISLGFLVDYVSGTPTGYKEAQEINFFKEIPDNIHPYHHQFLTTHSTEIWKKFS
jgi:ADP-ribose pyrophosphatase YjhB (NUDIX family)